MNVLALALLVSAAPRPASSDPFLPLNGAHRWGFKEGIQVAVHPVAIGTGGDGGPRGLLRIGYPILPDGKVSLLNFVAVEPTVGRRKGFSELEKSQDGKQGKLMTPTDVKRERKGGGELLRVSIDVEKFENGAHVRLEALFDSRRPGEVELRAFAVKGSAKMEDCILTATMGNYARLRRVYLAGGRVDESTTIFAEYKGNAFTPHHIVPVGRLARNRAGDVVVPATPSEADPAILQESLPKDLWWRFPGKVVTQYWRAPRGSFSPDLELRLNGRYTYWMSNIPIPGGVSFENFELRDRFRSGQPFVFGITTQPPQELLAPKRR